MNLLDPFSIQGGTGFIVLYSMQMHVITTRVRRTLRIYFASLYRQKMRYMVKRVSIVIMVVLGIMGFMVTGTVSAQTLKILFDQANAKPYAFIENEQLVGGIIKDIGDELAKELGIDVQYIQIPRKRYEEFLDSGKVHAILISNPAWFSSSTKYNWTIPMFQEVDVFMLSAKRVFPLKTFDDVNGKFVGTIRGFQYPAELQDKFDRQEVRREDVNMFEQNVKKLESGRIDCLINSNILIDYYLKEHHAHEQFVIAEKVVSPYDIHGLFSKQSPVSMDRVNAVFQTMKESGKLTEILVKYR